MNQKVIEKAESVVKEFDIRMKQAKTREDYKKWWHLRKGAMAQMEYLKRLQKLEIRNSVINN